MLIFKVEKITEEIVVAFQTLIPQLSEDAKIPTKSDLNKVVNSDSSYLFLAKDADCIVGTLTLVIYNIPTGQKVWIEDVVVDKCQRGKGVARKMIEAAVDFAHENGVRKIDLTSNSSRFEAHALYKKIGFKERNTTVFRLDCSADNQS